MNNPTSVETMRWVGDTDGHLVLIDQTLLPTEFVELDCRNVETVWEAIKMLRVRGAPAIGIAAAYGVVIGLLILRAANIGEAARLAGECPSVSMGGEVEVREIEEPPPSSKPLDDAG